MTQNSLLSSPLSGARYHQLIARYGSDVTVTIPKAAKTDKPWQIETSQQSSAEAKSAASYSGRALIQEPRFVAPSPHQDKSAYQQREALLEIAGPETSAIDASSLSEAYLKTGQECFRITHVSLLLQTGNKAIFKLTILAQQSDLS